MLLHIMSLCLNFLQIQMNGGISPYPFNSLHSRNSTELRNAEDPESSVSDCESSVSGAGSDSTGLFTNGFNRVDEKDTAHGVIMHRFTSCLDRVRERTRVIAIHRRIWSSFTAQAKLQAFQIYFRALANKNDGNANLKYAWFGTSKHGVNRIMTHGFGDEDIRMNSGLFGLGVYLSSYDSPLESVQSSTVDEDGLRHVLLCRVLLGKTELLSPGSSQSNPTSDEFDSGVDDLLSPKKYIFWIANMNAQILPEYVLSFRAAPCLGGSLRIETPIKLPTSPWMSFPALMNALSRLLPSHVVTLINKYHMDFKEKRISRLELIRQVRRLAGDKLLIAVIKSRRGKGLKAPTE
ncbi:hypothetical protein Nepgr_003118 [Nepenthes gracilis]|uniref:Poly [ADP-ribose] polymerase n=1 Tax=Nepenthes gracilis TaxID=150966 RepID=A0AAD3RZ07_NEPGR|nr:hypothetical protein Nepgr_003118 [Nepenthes gracilis]